MRWAPFCGLNSCALCGVDPQLQLLALAGAAGGVEAGHQLVARLGDVGGARVGGQLLQLPRTGPGALDAEIGQLLGPQPIEHVDHHREGQALGPAGRRRPGQPPSAPGSGRIPADQVRGRRLPWSSARTSAGRGRSPIGVRMTTGQLNRWALNQWWKIHAGDQEPGVAFVGVTGDQVGEGLAVAADRCLERPRASVSHSGALREVVADAAAAPGG